MCQPPLFLLPVWRWGAARVLLALWRARLQDLLQLPLAAGPGGQCRRRCCCGAGSSAAACQPPSCLGGWRGGPAAGAAVEERRPRRVAACGPWHASAPFTGGFMLSARRSTTASREGHPLVSLVLRSASARTESPLLLAVSAAPRVDRHLTRAARIPNTRSRFAARSTGAWHAWPTQACGAAPSRSCRVASETPAFRALPLPEWRPRGMCACVPTGYAPRRCGAGADSAEQKMRGRILCALEIILRIGRRSRRSPNRRNGRSRNHSR